MSIVTLFCLVGLSLLFFTAQIIASLAQVNTPQVKPTHAPVTSVPPGHLSPTTVKSTPVPIAAPFFLPNSAPTPVLELPTGRYVLFQDAAHIFLVSTTDQAIQPIYTPGYNYSQAVHPVLTASG